MDTVLKALQSMEIHPQDVNPLFTEKLVAEYYARNITFIVTKWIETEMVIPSDDVVDLFQKIIFSVIEKYL